MFIMNPYRFVLPEVSIGIPITDNIKNRYTSNGITASGDDLTTWNDEGTDNIILDTLYGTPKTSSLNGYDVADFSLSDTLIYSTDLTALNFVGHTVYVVCKNTIGTAGYLMAKRVDADTYFGCNTNDTTLGVVATDDAGEAMHTGRVDFPDDIWHVEVFQLDPVAQTSRFFSSGSIATGSNASFNTSQQYNTGYPLSLGAFKYTTQFGYSRAFIAELIIYNDIHDTSDINLMGAFFASKYSIDWIDV